MSNLLEYENRYYDLGYDYIIGLDEAGRGPMAGELVVAGVIFPKGFYDERIFDSKQLTAKKSKIGLSPRIKRIAYRLSNMRTSSGVISSRPVF